MHLEKLCTCFTSSWLYYTMMYVPILNNILLLEQSKQHTGVATNAEQCNLLLTVATPFFVVNFRTRRLLIHHSDGFKFLVCSLLAISKIQI